MSDLSPTLDADQDLTLQWDAQGIEDRPVDLPRTMTLRSSLRPGSLLPGDAIARLPRLLDHGDRSSLPQLRFKGLLGEGGMGRVDMAEQLSLGRDVATKQLRDDIANDEAIATLLREAWTTGRLEHPNIVPIYTLGKTDDDRPIIIMKKIEGTSWLELMDHPDDAPDPFVTDDPLAMHLDILVQVCNAIEYAHSRGIIHRDLKPENIMLGEFGEVYVLDWGIAVSLTDDPSGRLVSANDAARPAGTPVYMAPEMVSDDGGDLGPHTDIFLLGAILYETLTGHPPYDGDTVYAILMKAHGCQPPALPDHVSEELANICQKALARDPSERYADIASLRADLRSYRKRHEARRLVDKADARRLQMQSLLADERQGQSIDESVLYRRFGECRFAYEQALEIADDFSDATDGLQQALVAMAQRALRREAPKAASLLIADLPLPRPDLEEALHELKQRLARRQKERRNLEQIRHDNDAEVGKGSRALFVAVMGSLWTAMSLGLASLSHLDLISVTHPRMFVHIIGLTTLVSTVIFLGRRRFFTNEFNRRLLLSIIAVFAVVIVYRGIIWLAEIPYWTSFTIEMLIYGMAVLLMAMAYDKRLRLPAVPFLAGAVGAALWPATVLWWFTAANLVMTLLILWKWWPREG